MDTSKRKLLFVEENNNNYHSEIIDLSEVKTCRVKKTYAPITINHFKKNGIEEFLNSIALQLHFKNDKTPAALLFEKNRHHNTLTMKKLANKIRYCERILSKMLAGKEQNAA